MLIVAISSIRPPQKKLWGAALGMTDIDRATETRIMGFPKTPRSFQLDCFNWLSGVATVHHHGGRID